MHLGAGIIRKTDTLFAQVGAHEIRVDEISDVLLELGPVPGVREPAFAFVKECKLVFPAPENVKMLVEGTELE